MSAIYEVADGDNFEHVYMTAQPVTSSKNGDVKGDNSTGISKSFGYVTLGLLIFIALLIVAVLGVLLYTLQTKTSNVECQTPNVTRAISDEKLKQSYKPHEEINGLTCATGEKLIGDSTLVCQYDGTWSGSASCVQIECKAPSVCALIPGEMVKQSYKPGEEIIGLTCAAGEMLIGDSTLACLEDGTWRGSTSCAKIANFRGCPDGWIRHGNSCYLFEDKLRKTWNASYDGKTTLKDATGKGRRPPTVTNNVIL